VLRSYISKIIPTDDNLTALLIDGCRVQFAWTQAEQSGLLSADEIQRLRQGRTLLLRDVQWPLPDETAGVLGRVLAALDYAAECLDALDMDSVAIDRAAHTIACRLNSNSSESAVVNYLRLFLDEHIRRAVEFFAPSLGTESAGEIIVGVQQAVADSLHSQALEAQRVQEENYAWLNESPTPNVSHSTGADADPSARTNGPVGAGVTDGDPAGVQAQPDADATVPVSERAAGVRAQHDEAARPGRADDGRPEQP
jgi:hypothetical protein